MKKAERQQKIREIITNESIERQEDLVARLREMGLTVTQATISRDIKEMQLIKIPADNGGYRYGLPAYHHQGHENQLAQTLQDSLEQLKRNDCFLALTVHPGNGPVVATLIRKIQPIPVEPAVRGAGMIDGNVQNQLHPVFVECFG